MVVLAVMPLQLQTVPPVVTVAAVALRAHPEPRRPAMVGHRVKLAWAALAVMVATAVTPWVAWLVRMVASAAPVALAAQ
jgi:hypothetical protein